ncbi:MAG: HigA family addiction module antitoxin [Gammaproteobacteria bacterium]
MSQMHNPPQPGEILREWLADVSITEAAERLDITRVSLSRLLNGASGISAEMDVRLSKALGTTPGYWLGLQADYDLCKVRRNFKGHVRPIITPVV